MGGSPKAPAVTVSQPEIPEGRYTPNLFKAAEKYMPAQYTSNQPIYDPTAILNAYKNNLPSFLESVRSIPVTKPVPINTPVPVNTPTKRGK